MMEVMALFSTSKRGFRLISFEKISVLGSNFIHKFSPNTHLKKSSDTGYVFMEIPEKMKCHEPYPITIVMLNKLRCHTHF